MRQENRRHDIQGGPGEVVPSFYLQTTGGGPGRVIGGIGAVQVDVVVYCNGVTLNAGDDVSFLIPISGFYVMGHYVTMEWNPSEEGYLGCGFALTSASLGNLFAHQRTRSFSDPGAQEHRVNCMAARYFNAGDRVIFVGLLDSGVGITSGGGEGRAWFHLVV